jgi:hypothetical protein
MCKGSGVMKYKAFLSYKHTPFSQLRAERLERAIKRYARPIWMPPTTVFRDERILRPDALSSHSLVRCLRRSRMLLFWFNNCARKSGCLLVIGTCLTFSSERAVAQSE